MKLDLHCHTKEGSLDGKVPIEEYVKILKKSGIDGMLVTDHNSYNGYRYYKKYLAEKTDFVVLRGIEYDTRDAGHILVIMPSKMELEVLELRGMPVQKLIDVVHRYGGILGPAHPCGERFLSFMHTKAGRHYGADLLEQFDFLEVYNACEDTSSNEGARILAQKAEKQGVGGSDSHSYECIGTGYTEFTESIFTEDDLIAYIKERKPLQAYGSGFKGTLKGKLGAFNKLLVYSFWFYNSFAAAYRGRRRRGALRQLG